MKNSARHVSFQYETGFPSRCMPRQLPSSDGAHWSFLRNSWQNVYGPTFHILPIVIRIIQVTAIQTPVRNSVRIVTCSTVFLKYMRGKYYILDMHNSAIPSNKLIYYFLFITNNNISIQY